MSRHLFMLLLVITCVCGLARADNYPEYPFELNDVVRAKFVFVGFQDNVADTFVIEDRHMVAVEQIRDYLASHSNGTLTLTDDSGVLFRHGESIDPDNADPSETAAAWVAHFSPTEYIDQDAFDSSYPYYDELQDWWVNPETEGYCTQLYAEILWRIYNEYNDQGENPFASDDDTPWTLFFVFMKEGYGSHFSWPPGPWDAGVGGRPHIHVNPAAAMASTNGFFANLKTSMGGTRFAGAGQGAWNFYYYHDEIPGGDEIPAADASESLARVVLHEFVHTLPAPDGPPNLASTDYHEGRYYYGNLNLMCQHWDYGKGIPPISDPILADLPWNRGRDNTNDSSVVDLTGQDLRGHRIYDVRAGGQLARFSIGRYVFDHNDSGDEYFILAYHAGTGLDAQQRADDPDGGPIVPSQGLAIWHCIGDPRDLETLKLCDLESPTGLWSYGYPDPQPVFLPPNHPACIPGLVEDRVSGYDNYDLWAIIEDAQPDSASHHRTGYSDYKGDVFDFFRNDLTETNAVYPGTTGTYDLTAFNKSEFSFATNPNTYGYQRQSLMGSFLRRAPQNVPNSYVVKIGEKVSDPIDGDYVTIDISPGPWADIISPAAESTIDPPTTIPIAWSAAYDTAITAVDIDYSRDGGQSWTPLVEGYDPVDPDVREWSWNVEAEHASVGNKTSRIRITYHNNITDEVAVEVMPDGFTVTGAPVQAEDLIFPDTGDAIWAHTANRLRWTHNMSGPWQFMLQWTRDGGQTVDSTGTYLDFTIDPDTDQYVADWTPNATHLAPQVQFRLKCESHALSTTYGAWTSAVPVYPAGSGFDDVTLDSGLQAADWYDGIPSGAIPIDLDGDDAEDFIVSLAEDDDSQGAAVYRNVGGAVGVMAFESVFFNDAFSSDHRPIAGATGLVGGDLDRDGLRDLVIGMADGTGARIYGATGSTTTPLFADSSTAWVAPGALALLERAVRATIVDADHDGYEDLHLARVAAVDDVDGDALLLNHPDEQTSAPRFSAHPGWPLTRLTATVAWANHDRDGLWTVFGSDGLVPKLIQQAYDGRFSEILSGFPVEISRPVAACWLDVDHADGLDLAIATEYQGAIILFGATEGSAPFSSGLTIPYAPGWRPSSIATLDYDLDGWSDLILTGQRDDSQPMLLINLGDHADFEDRFVDVGAPVGLALGVVELSAGAAPADYDGDHDLDLLLARHTDALDGGRLYRNKVGDGSSANAHWIAFDFERDGEFAGVSIMGTVITLHEYSAGAGTGALLGSYVVDGGRGAGGQDSGLVTCGLGDYDGLVEFHLDLPTPSGSTIGYADADTIVDIADLASTGQLTLIPPLAVDTASLACKIEIQPYTGLLDWRFTWTTNTWTPAANDVVTLGGSSCDFTSATLTDAAQDVEAAVSYFVDPVTGERGFLHELVWIGRPCQVGCEYTFEVESSTSSPTAAISTATGTGGRIKVCPQAL